MEGNDTHLSPRTCHQPAARKSALSGEEEVAVTWVGFRNPSRMFGGAGWDGVEEAG